MELKVTAVDVWSKQMADEPGALHETIEILAEAGENLDFVVARRHGRGTAVLFLAPIVHEDAARAAGLSKATDLHALRVAAPNRRGLGAEMLRLIAADGIGVRGLSASVVGEQSVTYLAFDNEAEATKARTTLELDLPRAFDHA